MIKFKVNDKVKCVDEKPEGGLFKDQIYTITEANERFVSVTEVHNGDNTFYAHRFVLVNIDVIDPDE